MPRGKQPLLDKPTKTTLWIRESIKTRAQLALFSELEGCVPYGELSKLINSLLVQWLDGKQLDLRPYGIEGAVIGTPAAIEKLESMIQLAQQKEHEDD